MDPSERSLIENTNLLLRGFTDEGYGTSQVWFSSSARSSVSIAFHHTHVSLPIYKMKEEK
jgi:hypothetical protein